MQDVYIILYFHLNESFYRFMNIQSYNLLSPDLVSVIAEYHQPIFIAQCISSNMYTFDTLSSFCHGLLSTDFNKTMIGIAGTGAILSHLYE